MVRLRVGAWLAYEALARFEHVGLPSPGHAFAAAAQAGLGPQLELCAARRAFERLDDIPAGTWLGVNLSAVALMTPEAQDLLLHHATRNIGVELTEHTHVADYEALVAVTSRLRSRGVQIVSTTPVPASRASTTSSSCAPTSSSWTSRSRAAPTPIPSGRP